MRISKLFQISVLSFLAASVAGVHVSYAQESKYQRPSRISELEKAGKCTALSVAVPVEYVGGTIFAAMEAIRDTGIGLVAVGHNFDYSGIPDVYHQTGGAVYRAAKDACVDAKAIFQARGAKNVLNEQSSSADESSETVSTASTVK